MGTEQSNAPGKSKSQFFEWCDLAIKITGVLLTIVAISFSAIQFSRELTHKDEVEFKRNLWQMQVQKYSKACELAGKIFSSASNRDDKAVYNQHLREFTALYIGEINVVQDTVVEKAMQAFYYAAKDLDDSQESIENIQNKTNELARACGKAYKDSWRELAVNSQ